MLHSLRCADEGKIGLRIIHFLPFRDHFLTLLHQTRDAFARFGLGFLTVRPIWT